MNKYKETFKTWDKVARLYQDKFMDLDLYNDSYDFFCDKIITRYANLLEIGCGPGNITKYLLTKRPDFNIRGVDISKNMISLAKINNPTAGFEIMDVRTIDQIDSKFDGIIGGFCLPYLSVTDVEKLLVDCKDLLHQDGLLYMSFVESEMSESGYITGSSGDRSYFYFHTSAHLINHLTKNDFKELKTYQVPFDKTGLKTETHSILIARKS